MGSSKRVHALCYSWSSCAISWAKKSRVRQLAVEHHPLMGPIRFLRACSNSARLLCSVPRARLASPRANAASMAKPEPP
jgi:hypothetical protein